MSADILAELVKPLTRLKDAVVNGERKDFLEMGKEIEYYGYSKDYDKLYKEFEAQNKELTFKAKVNRASEFVEVVGPYLYPKNPVASVNSRPWATYWQRQRHKVEQDYLNYAIVEGDLSIHSKRAVNQACTYGRGVMWTGYNPEKKIIQNVFDTVDNLGEDPDARCPEDVNFKFRRRFKPRFQLLNLYPDAKEKILALPKSTERPSDEKNSDTMLDIIEYYEFYFRIGLHNYSSSLTSGDTTADGKVVLDDSPKKYILAGDVVLKVSNWEIPFFLDDMWPCENLDLRARPGKMWPASPLEPGLPHLKMLNWLYTFYLNRIRVATRTPLVVAKYNGQGIEDDQLVKLLAGNDLDLVRISINGDQYRINDLVQQFKLDAGVDELDKAVELLTREFEKSTGLTEFLYAGETNRQMRSAKEVDLKDKKSMSRIDEQKREVEMFASRLMRKTIFAARFLHTPEDIGAILGAEAGETWGTLAPPDQVAKEQAMRLNLKKQFMGQAQAMAQQAAMMPPVMGPMGPMPAPMPPMPTPEDIERQLGPEQLVSMEAWVNEADREIEAGSMRKLDHDAQVDNLNIALNQLAPAVVAMPGGPLFVAAIAREFTRINRYSPDMQAAADAFYQAASAPPPMPMPPPPQPTPGAKGPPAGGLPFSPK